MMDGRARTAQCTNDLHRTYVPTGRRYEITTSYTIHRCDWGQEDGRCHGKIYTDAMQDYRRRFCRLHHIVVEYKLSRSANENPDSIFETLHVIVPEMRLCLDTLFLPLGGIEQ